MSKVCAIPLLQTELICKSLFETNVGNTLIEFASLEEAVLHAAKVGDAAVLKYAKFVPVVYKLL